MNVNDILVDREFKDLLRKLTDQEYRDLEISIEMEGCREPLVVWTNDGKRTLLGGHNRFAICTEHGINFQTIEAKNITNRLEAKIWLLRDQLGRRNLNDFDRARFVLQFESLLKEQAKQHQLSGLKQYSSSVWENSPKRINTREVMAGLAGVSTNTISKVKFINENATQEQISQLEKGDISINNVHQKLRKKPQNSSENIKNFIKKFRWAVKRNVVPIGYKLIDLYDDLSDEQKQEVINTLDELREVSNKVSEKFKSEGMQ